MREENSVDGICLGCDQKQEINYKEEWHLNSLYKVGVCPACKYEHTAIVKKI